VGSSWHAASKACTTNSIPTLQDAGTEGELIFVASSMNRAVKSDRGSLAPFFIITSDWRYRS